MSLGLSLALTLSAGLHIDSGPVTLKRHFVANWGKTEVFVANSSGWELTRLRAWQQRERWSIQMALAHHVTYGLRVEAANQHPYGELRLHRRPWQAAYGDVVLTRVRHRTHYADLGSCRSAMRFAYWLTQQVAVQHALSYAVTNVNPIAKRLIASWSLLDDTRLQAVVNSPELVWNGRAIRILQASLSSDEDSPVWMAQISLAELDDFASISIGDALTLTLGLETFALIVDGKTLSRESVADQQCELSAMSPLALLDAPFAGTLRYYQPTAMAAQAAVEALIGPVIWHLPSWLIPAGRLMLEGITPLAAARNIVAAIGGIVESNPDGSVVCRRRHPVSIPQYAAASVAHSLFDTEVITARAQIAPSRGFNRVTIANEDGASTSSSDRIEFVADADNAQQGTVRAYLAVHRAVLLTHTGHAATVIASLGDGSRNETETLEFIEGRASTRYPVDALVDIQWQHLDLGAVQVDGQSLVAATPGYSLLKLSYTTRSLNWRVALALNEEVQFVLVDA